MCLAVDDKTTPMFHHISMKRGNGCSRTNSARMSGGKVQSVLAATANPCGVSLKSIWCGAQSDRSSTPAELTDSSRLETSGLEQTNGMVRCVRLQLVVAGMHVLAWPLIDETLSAPIVAIPSSWSKLEAKSPAPDATANRTKRATMLHAPDVARPVTPAVRLRRESISSPVDISRKLLVSRSWKKCCERGDCPCPMRPPAPLGTSNGTAATMPTLGGGPVSRDGGAVAGAQASVPGWSDNEQAALAATELADKDLVHAHSWRWYLSSSALTGDGDSDVQVPTSPPTRPSLPFNGATGLVHIGGDHHLPVQLPQLEQRHLDSHADHIKATGLRE
jgi:hypothetical protein